MIKTFFFILIISFEIIFTDDAPDFTELVFDENFESDELDQLKWDIDLGENEDYWKKEEFQYYRRSKENIFIENNQLHIRALGEKFGNYSYTSARISTKYSFHFSYGRLETKMKLPKKKGINSIFNLIGGNIDEVLWPKCGQMNLVEARNDENTIINSLYWEDSENKMKCEYKEETNLENINDFHIYSLTWTKEAISMSIDGDERFRIYLNENLKSDAFQKPFYLLLKLSVMDETTEIDNFDFPLEMVIDYIKIYHSNEYKCENKYLKSLVFYDDFNGEELDSKKWTYTLGNENQGWGTYQRQYYTNRTTNLYLEDSKLHIKAVKEPYKTYSYTSASISTNMNFTYGRIQANISFPMASGFGPELLLLGLYKDKKEPECGELDALVGVYNTTDSTTIVSGSTWGKAVSQKYYKKAEYDIQKFNEYNIIWDINYISVYAEDLELFRMKINSHEFEAFHNPHYINLNMLVGGYTVGPINGSAFPLEMITDYIKVYHYDIKRPEFNGGWYINSLALLILILIF